MRTAGKEKMKRSGYYVVSNLLARSLIRRRIRQRAGSHDVPADHQIRFLPLEGLLCTSRDHSGVARSGDVTPSIMDHPTYNRGSFRRFETCIKGGRHIRPWVNLGSQLQSIGCARRFLWWWYLSRSSSEIWPITYFNTLVGGAGGVHVEESFTVVELSFVTLNSSGSNCEGVSTKALLVTDVLVLIDDFEVELTLCVRDIGLIVPAIVELVVDLDLEWLCVWVDDGIALLPCKGLDAVSLPFLPA